MPGAEAVDGRGHQLFAGARLAVDYHRRLGLGGAGDQDEQLHHDWGLSDDAVKTVFLVQFLAQAGDEQLHHVGRLDRRFEDRVMAEFPAQM